MPPPLALTLTRLSASFARLLPYPLPTNISPCRCVRELAGGGLRRPGGEDLARGRGGGGGEGCEPPRVVLQQLRGATMVIGE